MTVFHGDVTVPFDFGDGTTRDTIVRVRWQSGEDPSVDSPGEPDSLELFHAWPDGAILEEEYCLLIWMTDAQIQQLSRLARVAVEDALREERISACAP